MSVRFRTVPLTSIRVCRCGTAVAYVSSHQPNAAGLHNGRQVARRGGAWSSAVRNGQAQQPSRHSANRHATDAQRWTSLQSRRKREDTAGAEAGSTDEQQATMTSAEVQRALSQPGIPAQCAYPGWAAYTNNRLRWTHCLGFDGLPEWYYCPAHSDALEVIAQEDARS
jgi:hypothetical protein